MLLVICSCNKDNDIEKNDFDISRLSIERITLRTPVLHFDFSDNLNGIGIDENNIYRTDDGGITWEQFNSKYENLQSVHLFDKNNILISGKKDIDGGNEFYVLISDDAGTTYEEVILYDSISHIFNISAFKDGTAYITTHNGILRSTDFGKSWMKIPNINIPVTKIIKKSNGELYCGSDGGIILMSVNNGVDWSRMSTNFDNYIYINQIFNNRMYFISDGELYSTEDFIEFKNHNRYFGNGYNYLHVMDNGEMVYFGSKYSDVGGFVPDGIICLTSNSGLSWNEYDFGVSDEWSGFKNGIRISDKEIIIQAVEGYEDNQLLHIIIN